MSGEKQIHINSMVASRDGSPQVTLKLGDQATQMPPEQARQIAQWLFEAAEAAESDAFLVNFLGKEMDLGQDYAVKILAVFRKKRGEQS